ncbi:MAG: hypothetical protein LBL20_01905 [Treponema sp.]|jgi:hypothetical protein|nr:hypothetical protein [Treponema sp.]
MKKALVVLLILAVAGGAFAQEVTVTGGGAAQFSPFGIVDPDDTTTTTDTDGLLPVAGFGKPDGDREAGIELQLNVAGTLESGRAGFLIQLRPQYNGGFGANLFVGDNAELWFKPLDWIRVDAGRFVNNDIRGRLGSGAWFGDFLIPRGGEGDIFQNFDAKLGVMASVKPAAIEGLGVYALVNSITLYGRENNTLTWVPLRRAEYVYENTQAAVSYALSGIGLARVQYVGAAPSATERTTYTTTTVLTIPNPNTPGEEIISTTTTTPSLGTDRYLPTAMWSITAPYFGAAFAFTGVTGLTVDVGGRFYLPFDDITWPHESGLGANNLPAAGTGTQYGWSGVGRDGKYQAPHWAALGVQYQLLPITLYLRFDVKFGGYGEGEVGTTTTKLELGPEIRGWLTANYKINDTFSAQAEGGIVYAGESKATRTGTGIDDSWTAGSDAFLYGFGLGLQTSFSASSYVRIGATFTSGKGMGVSSNPAVDAESRVLGYASSFNVPIIMQVSF